MNIPRSVRDRCDLVEFGKINANSVLPGTVLILQNEGLIFARQRCAVLPEATGLEGQFARLHAQAR